MNIKATWELQNPAAPVCTADDSRQLNRAANNLEEHTTTLTPFIALCRLQLPLVNALAATTLLTTLSQANTLQQTRSKNTLIKLIY